MLTHVEDDLDLDRDPWEMANLYPRDTGLRHTVWVSPRGRARHDARVKVCMAPGDRMDPDNLAVMSIRPTPRLLHGELPPRDEMAVRAWIELNAPLLLGYWEGTVSTVELAKGLQTISPE
jgi:hypothetical protein